MSFSKDDIKKLIKEHVANYPDIEKMLAEGSIVKKSGWYEVKDKASFDALSSYVTSVRSTKSGNAQIKFSKPSKKLGEFASRV